MKISTAALSFVAMSLSVAPALSKRPPKRGPLVDTTLATKLEEVESSSVNKCDEKIDLIINPNNNEGLQDLLDMGGKHLSQLNIVTVSTSVCEMERRILNNSNIHSLDMDSGVEAFGNLRESRKLSEETPYGLTMVQSTEFKGLELPDEENIIKVCVADTGYDNGHNDLPELNNGSDGYSQYNQKWHEDGHGHGTHCAGTIGAIGGNGKGVDSVLSDKGRTKFYIGKALSDSGSGSNAGVMAAVEACANNGAKVISLSLGGGGYSATTAAAYKKLSDEKGVLLIAAAGNGGNSAKSYPASYPALMSVAAVDSSEKKAGFSQFNDQVEISGPGVAVKSTLPNNKYASWSGTSMATPHVAGVASLVWSYFPDCTNKQIRQVLLRTAKKTSAQGDVCTNQYGHGIVQAKDAYDMLLEQGCDAGGLPAQEDIGGCDQLEDFPTQPVFPPNFDCDNGQTLTVEVITDRNPGQTSYELELQGSTVGEYDGYTVESARHLNKHCLTSAGTYKFTISDSGGDGLTDGEILDGSYKVLLNDKPLFSGSDFGSSETNTFEICDSSRTLTVDITTDNYGGETSYTLEGPGGFEESKAASDFPGSNTLYTNQYQCIEPGQYKFTIKDAYGDGICCSYGQGGYQIYAGDGNELASGGEFAGSETKTFTISAGDQPPPTDSCVESSDSNDVVYILKNGNKRKCTWILKGKNKKKWLKKCKNNGVNNKKVYEHCPYTCGYYAGIGDCEHIHDPDASKK